jgi:predicted nucleic acid-binding Zn ribbon protein
MPIYEYQCRNAARILNLSELSVRLTPLRSVPTAELQNRDANFRA